MSECIFCAIASGVMAAQKLYEDEDMVAFQDLAPQGPVHFLVIPKKHIPNIMELSDADTLLMGKLLQRAQTLAREQGCEKQGARFVINCKAYGGQTVDHLHIHVIGGRPLDWPPG
jgi:histidine triad (HIT) family protein